jgi:hypothetical protein
MAIINLCADSPTGHYLECDGCRKKLEIVLPMAIFELTVRMLEFDAAHRFCQKRPVTRCEYVDPVAATCAHDRNLTPECGIDSCPLA